MRELLYKVCYYTRYDVSFYLWLIRSVPKHCKVPKYYDKGCRCYISRCYDTSKPIKRELIIYGATRPRAKFSNENGMALQGQVGSFSFEGELARLDGLASLGEISPSLRNSYKNIMCSYEK